MVVTSWSCSECSFLQAWRSRGCDSYLAVERFDRADEFDERILANLVDLFLREIPRNVRSSGLVSSFLRHGSVDGSTYCHGTCR
jgi:hypothetical protein